MQSALGGVHHLTVESDLAALRLFEPRDAPEVIVLPQPLGPSRVNASPCVTEKLTPRTAATPPFRGAVRLVEPSDDKDQV